MSARPAQRRPCAECRAPQGEVRSCQCFSSGVSLRSFCTPCARQQVSVVNEVGWPQDSVQATPAVRTHHSRQTQGMAISIKHAVTPAG